LSDSVVRVLLPRLDAPLPAASMPRLQAAARVCATFSSLLATAVRAPSLARGLSEGARARRQALEAHHLGARLAELNGVRIRVVGALPLRTSMLVANHLGYWDAVVLSTLLPLVAIAKSELAQWPVLGTSGRALGTLYVRRGDAHDGARVLRLVRRRLLSGVHVLNFPEGTTSPGGTVLPFRRGVFGAAAQAHVPVVPVALRLWPPDAAWLGGEAFLPHYARHWQRGAGVQATVCFGAPLSPRDFSTASACAAEARAQVEALLRGTGAP
jgi:lyso-ornithine lipid O-acyltransferase